MPKLSEDTVKKRQQLKKDLYNLLLTYSDGVLKVNIWGLLSQKTALKLNNSEFRVGNMNEVFRLFSDMIHEENRDGKTYICLNQHFSWESNPELQQRGLKTMTFENTSQSSLLGTPGFVTATSNPALLPWQSLRTTASQPAQMMGSDSFIAQQIATATQGMNRGRMPGFRTTGPIPSLLPTPVAFQLPSTPDSANRTGATSRQSVESSHSESESSEDEADDRGYDKLIELAPEKYDMVKKRLVKMLTNEGPLRLRDIQKNYKKQYNHMLKFDTGISLGKTLKMFGDVIERFKPDNTGNFVMYRVKNPYLKKQTVPQWGQGVRQRQDSSSSTDTLSAQGGQIIDLTSENVIDLTGDSSFISLSSTPGPSTSSQRKDDFISLEMNPPTSSAGNHHGREPRDRSLDKKRQTRFQPSHSATDLHIEPPAPYESLHALSRPVNKKRFDEKELNVTPVRRVNRYGRPPKDQVENVAQECIEILAESNCFVSQERVEKLLLQRFQVRFLGDLGVRYIDQIGCVNEHNRVIGKVNAYVQAFMKVRTICTLHELKECLKDFSLSKDDFLKLNIGPLQRLPIVYQMFKFPTDMEEIPPITTIDILEHLRCYLTKKGLWSQRAELEDFMEYLVEAYDADDAYQLGIRIRSLALGIQVLKKAQRDTGQTVRGVSEGFKEQLRKDIETVFLKFRSMVINTTSDGTWEVRNHYLKLRPEMAIQEIFQKFNLIMSMDEPKTKPQKKQHQKIQTAISNFLECVKGDMMAKTLFHLAICVSNSVLEESAMEILEPQEKESTEDVTVEERVKPPRDTLITSLKKYLERCLQHGTLTLSLLDKIEEKIAEESKFPSFSEMGYGRFLQFTLQEAKGLLEECGGTSVGSGSGGTDTASGYKPTHTDILSFIHQCMQCGKEQEEEIDVALCNQFNVKEVKDLGYGKTINLITGAKKPGQHKYQEHSVVFEVAVGTDLKSKSQESKIGMLGHQTKEAALACLHNCPLMEDIATWSHWSLVFEPELGKLKDFIQKYGGTNTIPIDGGKRLFTYHIAAMETKPGTFMKLTSNTSTEQFEDALIRKDTRSTCGQLLSLIVANKGLTNSPLALLANQMRSHLFTLHASDSSHTLPGAPPSDDKADEAVKFVLKCLTILPVKSCVSLANQIFLEPLGQVVGSSTSKFQLLSACETAEEMNRLQELGCMLGIAEWTNQIQKKCQVMMIDTEIVPDEEAEMIVLDDEEESDVESDTTSVTSSLSSILSDGDDDDVQIVSVEREPDIKKETVQKAEQTVEISTGDEDTQTESDNDKEPEFTVVDEIKEDETTEEQMTVTKETEEDSKEEKDNKEDRDDSKEDEEEIKEDSSDSEMEIMTEEERLQKECEKVVNNIRREEFGIGIELNEDGQKLKKVQEERLGRSLDRLSKDLYSKDTHFVLELIQNADDNDYPDSLAKNGENASVKFVMQTDGVIVLNNESGFLEKNIRALCDVGRSTKGKHKFGYIGQKGIGFKSVFRVTDRPEVHSSGYHICFDVQSGPMGYILPHLVEDTWEIGSGWTTKIVLPLKDEMKVHMRSLAARFNDIHPSLLLFLHRLREITIDNRVENSSQVMRRKDLKNGVIEIEHNNGTDRWLVVKKMLDASKISLQAKSGVEVESTEIALAFPLSDQFLLSKVMPPKQPVFAFLPLRSYGFRFIIQADFDVPSSREDVDRDSAWNQWIRNEIHKLFLEALEVFKGHDEFKGMKALIAFLQFIPMEDEILDFFRPVSTQILKQFRAKPCLPTQPNSKGIISWKLPTQVVTVKDSLVREVVTPEFLQRHLDLFYLHREVADMLNPTLIQCLGIESLSTNHLIQIGKVITVGKSDIGTDDKIVLIAKWLACVYRSLDEFHDNQEVYNTLMSMKIIPLASKEFVSLEDNTVFFPISSDQRSYSQYRDPKIILQEDMNTIHPRFLYDPDNEVNSQVQKILTKLSVCQLSPQDVINRHILPILKSDIWKTKKRETLISYLVFIKDQTERDNSLVNMDELANVAIVMTNEGEKNPKRDSIHFTPLYGNRYHLTQTFPGYDWCLIDAVYIQNITNNADKQKWHRFFSRLGITDFITVRHVKVELDSESVKESPWGPVAQLYPEDFSNGCVVDDFSCDEIRDLLKFNKIPQTYELQMKSLCEYLDQIWDTQFSRYTKTKLVRKDTNQEREVESSFSIWLKNLDWLPAIEVKAKMDSEGVIKISENLHRMPPSALYYPFSDITRLLSHTVMYVDVQFNIEKSTFAKFLGLKFDIMLDDLVKMLKQWGQRSDTNTPSLFATSHDHIQALYHYLGENLTKKQIQDLLDKEPVIFVPVQIKKFDYGDMVPKQRFPVDVGGQMVSRQEVWWEDRTGMFQKYHNTLTEIHADVGNKKILSTYMRYVKSPELQEFFKTGRIQMCPEVTEYAELLVHVASVQSRVEQETLEDVMKIFSVIGEHMYIPENDPEFETKKLLVDDKQKKVMNHFKGQNIIPTKKRIWTSLDNNPLMADNKEYEQIFQDIDKVHFVLIEENIRQRRQNRQSFGGKSSYLVNQDALMHVLRLCGIEDLTAVVEEEIITELYEPCPRLQSYMVQCVPLLQKFLYSNYTTVYQSLINGEILNTMSRLQCIQTSKLEVRYWFKSDPDIYAIRPETCTLKNEQFIFHKDAVESFGEINKVIARVFSQNDNSCLRELRNFLTDIQSCITGQSNENVDQCLWRYNAGNISNSEEIWTVPAPIIPEPIVEPVEEEEVIIEEEEEVFLVTEDGADKGQESNQMKAWPPMSSGVDKSFPPRQKVQRDDKKESKVWPPPKAPDYMKSLKELPSSVKVVEGESTGDDEGTSQRYEDGEGAAQYSTQVYRGPPTGQTSTGQGEAVFDGYAFAEGERSQFVGQGQRTAIPLLGEDGRPTGQDGEPIPLDNRPIGQDGRPSTPHDGSDSRPHTGHDNRTSTAQGHDGRSQHDGNRAHSGNSEYRGDNQQGEITHTPQRRLNDEQMVEQDGSSSAKRRHTSGGSDYMSQPSAKRPALRLGMPVWEKELGEYEEEELAVGDKLKLPAGMMFDNNKTSEMPEIGRWGELTVYQYLLKEMDENPNVTFVNWCNEDEELGQPYDFEVGVVTEQENFTVYIEVKSTLSNTKEIFEISYPQIKFAQENKDRFHVYRIFNASTPDQVRLVRIQNLAEKINEKHVRLCLLI